MDLLHCAAHYLSFQSALNQYVQHSEEGALCVSSTGALDGFRCYIFAVKISTAESLCSCSERVQLHHEQHTNEFK